MSSASRTDWSAFCLPVTCAVTDGGGSRSEPHSLLVHTESGMAASGFYRQTDGPGHPPSHIRLNSLMKVARTFSGPPDCPLGDTKSSMSRFICAIGSHLLFQTADQTREKGRERWRGERASRWRVGRVNVAGEEK